MWNFESCILFAITTAAAGPWTKLITCKTKKLYVFVFKYNEISFNDDNYRFLTYWIGYKAENCVLKKNMLRNAFQSPHNCNIFINFRDSIGKVVFLASFNMIIIQYIHIWSLDNICVLLIIFQSIYLEKR